MTAADLAKWAALPITAARRAIEVAASALVAADIAGEAAWRAADAPDPAAPGSVLALPAFDELVVGYDSREPVLRGLSIATLAPTSNGRFLPFIAVDGRLAATWDAAATPRVTPKARIQPHDLARAEAEAARWSAWLHA